MDHFREEVVTKRNRTVESVLYALSFVVMIVSGLITVFMFNLLTMAISTQGFSSGMIMDIVFTVLMAATAVLLFLYKDRIKTGVVPSPTAPWILPVCLTTKSENLWAP